MSEMPKPVRWIGSSRDDLRKFPEEVKDSIGIALRAAQTGRTAPCAKPFRVGKGSGAGVMEIVEDFDTNTYRAVYTVKFRDVVYGLHCFQKKSKKGISTPKHDIELIEARLKRAEADYRQTQGG
ncbi:MAG TPA: type II toxin-antitoxin system RelE/ParE family toxin [Chloroflexota bacterium]|nr:type II toxin-antitoxin system RelE/ParE family toxin [Chloroflexota bacterium]